MTDIEILRQLHKNLQDDDSPLCNPAMTAFYGKLIDRVPEDGLDLQLLCRDLTETEEWGLTLLNMHKYVDSRLCHHTGDGCYYYNVNLRGQQFMEIANNQVKPVAVAMQDSGKREVFETGAVRDGAEGKPRPDLFSPLAMERIGLWLMKGAQKYSEHNWTRGIPASRCLASLYRHLMKYQLGATDEDHLSGVMANCMFLLHFDEAAKRGLLPESLLDLPQYNSMPSVRQNGENRCH